MKQILKPGDTFIDIGANIGYETIWGAFLVGASGSVYSFEPIAHLAEQIKESLMLNQFSNVHLIQKASGEKEGVATIYFHPEDAGLTSFENKLGATESASVEITTVDTELAGKETVTLIKLDVEGYEYESLRGAENLLKKYHPVIVFEFSPHLYEQSEKGKSLKIFNYLHDLGYKISPIYDPKKVIEKSNFEALVKRILDDETIPNFVAR